MTLTKQTAVDKVEVLLEQDVIHVRMVTRILEGSEVLSQTYHRHVLQSGDDLTNEDERVLAIANAIWSN